MGVVSRSGRRGRRTMLAAVGVLVVSLVAACGSDDDASPATAEGNVITTASGPVRGEDRDGVRRFLGLPYAQSISGENRFAPPQPVEGWTDVRAADRYADSCPQPQASGPTGATPISPAFESPDYVSPGDDCLALNVWTPANADGSLPVMVWLHGGGWTSGAGSEMVYDGENLAGRDDVVVVTVNHRLGASGLSDFSRLLGGEFEDSSNLAIRDLIASLEWVRDNIGEFGGDPDLVTIFGESGGGWKVSTLLGAPGAEGLFDRAIIQSGPLTRFMRPEEADEVAGAMLDALGITPETADRLNSISADDVVAAESQVMEQMPMAMQSPGFPSGFWPVLDEDILPQDVFDPDAAPTSRDVPLLVGQTGTEFTLFMLGDQAAYSLDEAGLEQRVTQIFGPENSAQILATYRRDFPDYDPSGLWFRIYSDYAMGTLSSEILNVRSQTGEAPVYAYRFDWQTPIEDGRLLSPHTIEIPFVFDNTSTEAGEVMTGGGEPTADLAAMVSSAWVEFARTGSPAADGLPDWPQYSTENRESMHLDTTSEVAPYMDPAIQEIFRNQLWEQAGQN